MNTKKTNRGYTLIEVLIVITILGIIMPAVFSILYVILQQQAKIAEMTEVKRQGDYVMQFMKEKITREASGVRNDPDGLSGADAGSNVCNTTTTSSLNSVNGDEFVLIGKPPNLDFQFTNDGSQVFFDQNGIQTALNDTRVTINNFNMSCSWRSLYTPPMIGFSYEVTFNRANPDAELGITKMYYQSKFMLRTGDSD